jgi:hypothetical protein
MVALVFVVFNITYQYQLVAKNTKVNRHLLLVQVVMGKSPGLAASCLPSSLEPTSAVFTATAITATSE